MYKIWLINLIFNFKTNLKKFLKNQTKEVLEECLQYALEKNNFELAAYLRYYIDFKYDTDGKAEENAIKDLLKKA